MNKQSERDTYIIPPNFIDTGTFFGGLFKARNVIEAGILSATIGLPVLFCLPYSLTTRIILLCLTALPLALVALIGIDGESLSSFLLIALRYLLHRRIVGGTPEELEEIAEKAAAKQKKWENSWWNKSLCRVKSWVGKWKRSFLEKRLSEEDEDTAEDAPDEDTVFIPAGMSLPGNADTATAEKAPALEDPSAPDKKGTGNDPAELPGKWYTLLSSLQSSKDEPPACLNPVADYLPVLKIENGIVYTRDKRYIKIVEVAPINFLLRSASEQRGILYSFLSYLKISPVRLQFKVLTRRAEISRHIDTVRREMEQEENEQCRLMQEDYLHFVNQIGSREAITRRFFLIFEHEPWGARRADEEQEAVASLQSAVHTAANYLRPCGNDLIFPENEDEAAVEMLYSLLCRNESAAKPLAEKAREVTAQRLTHGRDIDHIPTAEFFAPQRIDFTHGSFVCIDGLYYAWLMIPSDGYKAQVTAGWLSLLVNAGDGIDLDFFLARQPKERIIQKVGQQLRINRSKLKDASDTNTDFDDIDNAIQSGYFLKQGLANNEDFYYMNLLITITAPTQEALEWKIAEIKKLLLSQDMRASLCRFRQEQAFLSALPLASMDKGLFERSKRNLLSGGAASCYPFTSYEMCDDNGILLGVNQYNRSLIIVDLFNSAVYKNANMVILGTTGAGKTFTMQLMALRMRRKGIPVFIIAPLKGHEFHRACTNVGGSFIQITPASPHCINVMEIRKVDHSTSDLLDAPDVQLSELTQKIQNLHIFFSLLIPDMTHEERQLLDEALIRTYQAKGITHDNDSLADPAHPEQYREMPVLGDLHAILKVSAETKRMANILNRFVHGSASTFNQQTNVSLDNKYTVLDISSLTGDLLTVGMFVALDFVWDRAKADRTEEKAIFIDECWQLLSGAGEAGTRLAGDYVLDIFKTIRGYGGAAVCASQDLNDFFSQDNGRFGKGIVNAAKTKIVLNLEEDEAALVQSKLHLSDAEVLEVTHFERGSGLIATNNNNIMVEFKASPLEKDLITTDRRELKEIVARKRAEQGQAAEPE